MMEKDAASFCPSLFFLPITTPRRFSIPPVPALGAYVAKPVKDSGISHRWCEGGHAYAKATTGKIGWEKITYEMEGRRNASPIFYWEGWGCEREGPAG